MQCSGSDLLSSASGSIAGNRILIDEHMPCVPSIAHSRTSLGLPLAEVARHLQEKAISIWESENFFLDLEPLPGAVEAVKQMANLENTDVFICTSPTKMYKYCPYEKYAWVEKHFGSDFLDHIVLATDKTVVSADLLIDDRPDITGAEPNPSWEHILFTACHNRHVQLQPPGRRLHSWADDWKAILDSKRPR
ncbi:5'(3')-deoxyribonucleotidase, mitochondrial isoform X2 [Leptonychotes weddellii]|uniref:5'(3')-deoxyribonucleotidase, mitochondrial isoform X2 n=1 Tax=Leptonychotes weddellii TaxID=9713 RepID=A0A7F8RSY5_LEPWE|nr:5'(3')-deoxyribonucleotidase, mitochondrial isoform X2 [Leptonychotes weddellii]